MFPTIDFFKDNDFCLYWLDCDVARKCQSTLRSIVEGGQAEKLELAKFVSSKAMDWGISKSPSCLKSSNSALS